MGKDDFKKLHDYLKKVKNPEDDHCWFCKKTPEQIKELFFEFKKNPKEGFEDISIEDIAIMTYKTKQPICASCYFTIKHNWKLIEEVFDSSEEDVWS